MALIDKEGKLKIGTTILFSAETVCKIKSLRFNNTVSPFVLVLYKTTEDSKTKIWELTLNTGDTVTDTFEYILNSKNGLEITCDVAGTSYLLSGEIL